LLSHYIDVSVIQYSQIKMEQATRELITRGLISKKVAEFETHVNENKSLIKSSKIVIFKFPDNYFCEQDEMFQLIKNIHMSYSELIKHNLINKGFEVSSMEYKDDYFNYADCYVSKCVYLLK
jgi:hypothetical protein